MFKKNNNDDGDDDNTIKKQAKDLNKHFSKKIHKWPTGTRKDVQSH